MEELPGRGSRRHCPSPDQATPPSDRQLRPPSGGSDVLPSVGTRSPSPQPAQPRPQAAGAPGSAGRLLSSEFARLPVPSSPACRPQASEGPCQARASFFRLRPPSPRPGVLSRSGAAPRTPHWTRTQSPLRLRPHSRLCVSREPGAEPDIPVLTEVRPPGREPPPAPERAELTPLCVRPWRGPRGPSLPGHAALARHGLSARAPSQAESYPSRLTWRGPNLQDLRA